MTDEEAKLLDAVDEHFEELICGDSIEPKIVLSLNEAKALLRRIPEFKENGDWQLPIERLKERISKAEGK